MKKAVSSSACAEVLIILDSILCELQGKASFLVGYAGFGLGLVGWFGFF